MSMNAVTTAAADLNVVSRYAAIAPWCECCATDAARIAAHRGERNDNRCDDGHVVIIVIASDAAVMPLNLTHGHFLPCLMVSHRSNWLGLRRTQTVDSILNFEPLLTREGREQFRDRDGGDKRRSLLGRRHLPIESG